MESIQYTNRRRKLGFAMFIALTGVFLLVGSRERPWGDANIMYQVGERIVAAGQLDVSKEWPPMSHRGADGKIYSQYALGPSLIAVPGIAIRNGINKVAPHARPLTLVVTSHLPHAMLGALVCVLFFFLCQRLGVSPKGALISMLVLGFGTSIFVYTRSPFSEILQTGCFLGFFSEVLRVPQEPSRRRALWLGAWAGMLFNAKLIFAISILGGGLYIGIALWGRKRELIRVLVWTAVTGLPFVGLALFYNYWRWGSMFDSGYTATLDLLSEDMFVGLWGLLLSPGKSLFLYSPPLLLGVLALPTLYRRAPHILWAMVLCALPPILLYSKFLSWAGDYAWGPRYLTFVVPLLMIPVALWVDTLLSASQRWFSRSLVAAVVVVGMAVQVLGGALYWDHYIRISMKTRQEWLGVPNRSGAMIAEKGRGHCDSCFEDMHGHQWLPPFSPIAGHRWLLKHIVAQDTWEEAQVDAPWRRYTSLESTAAKPIYDAARVDWWGLLWIQNPSLRAMGIGWGILFLCMSFGGMVWAVRMGRHRPVLRDKAQ